MLKQENTYGSQQDNNGEAEPDTKSLSYVHYMDLKKVAPNGRRRSQVTSKIPSGTAPALEQAIMCTFEQRRMKKAMSTIATLLSMLMTFCLFIKTPETARNGKYRLHTPKPS